MLVAVNFDKDKFVKTGIEELAKVGFVVGSKVEVVKRFTVSYDPEDTYKYRKDVTVGTELFIKGYAGAAPEDSGEKPKAKAKAKSDKAKLVFHFEADFGKKGGLKSVDVAIDPQHVRIPPTTVAGSEPKKNTTIKKYPFLEVEGDARPVEVVATWSKRVMASDTSVQTERKK